jgi:hypothetical protein
VSPVSQAVIASSIIVMRRYVTIPSMIGVCAGRRSAIGIDRYAYNGENVFDRQLRGSSGNVGSSLHRSIFAPGSEEGWKKVMDVFEDEFMVMDGVACGCAERI